MSEGVDDLIALLTSAGGALSHYDDRLQTFERNGVLQAALEGGQVVRTPIGYELPSPQQTPDPVVQLLLGLIAALVCLIIVGESLNWWNVFKENPRRGDWHARPLESSKAPFEPSKRQSAQ